MPGTKKYSCVFYDLLCVKMLLGQRAFLAEDLRIDCELKQDESSAQNERARGRALVWPPLLIVAGTTDIFMCR